MLKEGISRRQFVGGAAAVIGAAALPVVTSAAPAAADTGVINVAGLAGACSPWIPLDPVAAARQAWQIYWAKGTPGQSG
jgi:hypothetical protein